MIYVWNIKEQIYTDCVFTYFFLSNIYSNLDFLDLLWRNLIHSHPFAAALSIDHFFPVWTSTVCYITLPDNIDLCLKCQRQQLFKVKSTFNFCIKITWHLQIKTYRDLSCLSNSRLLFLTSDVLVRKVCI